MRQDPAWSSIPRVANGHFIFLPFPNHINSCHLQFNLVLFIWHQITITVNPRPLSLLALCRSVISSLMSFYEVFVLAYGGGEVGMEETDSMDRFIDIMN